MNCPQQSRIDELESEKARLTAHSQGLRPSRDGDGRSVSEFDHAACDNGVETSSRDLPSAATPQIAWTIAATIIHTAAMA